MLLVADIGNTNITLGVFEGKNLLLTFRLTTKTPRTSDEYGFLISDIIRNRGFNPEDIDKAIQGYQPVETGGHQGEDALAPLQDNH